MAGQFRVSRGEFRIRSMSDSSKAHYIGKILKYCLRLTILLSVFKCSYLICTPEWVFFMYHFHICFIYSGYSALLMFFENLAFGTDIKLLVKLVVYLMTAWVKFSKKEHVIFSLLFQPHNVTVWEKNMFKNYAYFTTKPYKIDFLLKFMEYYRSSLQALAVISWVNSPVCMNLEVRR